MITPIHVAFKLLILFFLSQFTSINSFDLIFLLSAELIDLDHLFSRPIYHPKRNPFKKHFLHRNWKFILLVATIFLFIRPIMFLGIGLMSHLFLDYIYIKMNKI